jgi:hypothetical protein
VSSTLPHSVGFLAVIGLMRAADEPVGKAVKEVRAILPYHLE